MILQLRALPALRLAQISTEVDDTTEISTVVGPLSDLLVQRLTAAGLRGETMGPAAIRRPDGSRIDVAAGVPVDALMGPIAGVEIVDLLAEATGASVVHRGPASNRPHN